MKIATTAKNCPSVWSERLAITIVALTLSTAIGREIVYFKKNGADGNFEDAAKFFAGDGIEMAKHNFEFGRRMFRERTQVDVKQHKGPRAGKPETPCPRRLWLAAAHRRRARRLHRPLHRAAAGRDARPRTRAPVVRRPGDDALVGRPLAQ